MDAPQLLYLGATLPDDGPSSPIILLRHFTRLTDAGWSIAIAHPAGAPRPAAWPASWISIALPSRRRWWPPVRRGWPASLTLRRWLVMREIDRRVPLRRVTSLITLLPDFPEEWQWLARAISRTYGVPEAVLVHDEAEAWTQSPEERRRSHARLRARLAQGPRAWCVSEELIHHYGLQPAPRAAVLRPIPAGQAWSPRGWEKRDGEAPVVAHAGKLFPEYLPALGTFADQVAAAGARFLVVGDPKTPGLRAWLDAHPRIEFQAFLPSNQAGLAFLRRLASMLLVFYPPPHAACAWSNTSFPSKLVEYSHLGLPILIAAGPETAVGNWARQRRWPTRVDDVAGPDVRELVLRLRRRPEWEAAAAAATHAAETEFSASVIQAQFLRELPQRVTSPLPAA